jgi:hypothetical protein
LSDKRRVGSFRRIFKIGQAVITMGLKKERKPKLLLYLDEDDEKVWEEFKKLVPRTITLNDAVILLIKKAVKDGEEVKEIFEGT